MENYLYMLRQALAYAINVFAGHSEGFQHNLSNFRRNSLKAMLQWMFDSTWLKNEHSFHSDKIREMNKITLKANNKSAAFNSRSVKHLFAFRNEATFVFVV